ncbi:MAG: metallophosphoesterase [Gammaproteobacteria bacterium]|nr:metallophosphoesterase [Gammaproteobacteria bacterium]
MKIGILSDSHDHIENIKKAADLFRISGTEMVIHAGDIVSPPALKSFAGMNLVGVLGNNDGELQGLMRVSGGGGGELSEHFRALKADGVSIAIYHGTVPELKDALVECGKYQVVISGHTHEVVNKQVGETLVLNPGSAHGFGKQATVMLLETPRLEVNVVKL